MQRYWYIGALICAVNINQLRYGFINRKAHARMRIYFCWFFKVLFKDFLCVSFVLCALFYYFFCLPLVFPTNFINHITLVRTHTRHAYIVSKYLGARSVCYKLWYTYIHLFIFWHLYIYDHNCARIHSFTVTELDWGGVGVVMHCKTVT